MLYSGAVPVRLKELVEGAPLLPPYEVPGYLIEGVYKRSGAAPARWEGVRGRGLSSGMVQALGPRAVGEVCRVDPGAPICMGEGQFAG